MIGLLVSSGVLNKEELSQASVAKAEKLKKWSTIFK
jgi:hypothetical protein